MARTVAEVAGTVFGVSAIAMGLLIRLWWFDDPTFSETSTEPLQGWWRYYPPALILSMVLTVLSLGTIITLKLMHLI